MEKTALLLHNLTVTYRHKPAIWNLDFEVPTGRLIGILGPNGSGKTTMLKTIMGLLKPDSGYVKVLGEAVDAVRDKIAYVPQRSSVDWDFPITVKEVVGMGRYKKGSLLGRISKADKAAAQQAMERVAIQQLGDRQISQLSGGQQQRVFIARALAQGAELYLLDEPFAGVDASTERAVIALLKELRDEGKTVVVVHHDLNTARQYFDYLILLNTRLVAAGPTLDVFQEDILQDTFGGQLSIMHTLIEELGQKQYSVREGQTDN